jgi:hypothetical protein
MAQRGKEVGKAAGQRATGVIGAEGRIRLAADALIAVCLLTLTSVARADRVELRANVSQPWTDNSATSQGSSLPAAAHIPEPATVTAVIGLGMLALSRLFQRKTEV